jgi:predicted ATP-grasp superfamily ATP-dependent carboligase
MSLPRILIVGGSTRAAADSVRRAGGQPVCADLFADFDLRMTADVVPVHHYPFSLPEDVKGVHSDGWFYCGALENHPEILEKLLATNASCGQLLGTAPDALRLVRNPLWLANLLRSAGINALEVVDPSTPPDADGTWIQKPLASAGGRSIRVWDETATRIPFREPHYFQRAVSGIGMSAIFRAERRSVDFLGASSEIESPAESQSPSRFSYCGSYGPWNDSNGIRSPIREQLQAIANTLLESAPGLHGLIGLDFRLCHDEVWLTEVNPRYTASVEVLELATGRPLLNLGISECLPTRPDWLVRQSKSPRDERTRTVNSFPRVIGKQILYAKEQFVAPDLSRFRSTDGPWEIPFVADIPTTGSVVEPGWPICTVLAGGTDAPSVHSLLRSRLKLVQSALSTTMRQH